MGTNYYLQQPVCPHCGHVPGVLHIGKSSSGWNFCLRIYPKIGGHPDERLAMWGIDEICELDDWKRIFDRFPIFDERDVAVSVADMIATITERSHPQGLLSRLTAGVDHMGPFVPSLADKTHAGRGTYDLCNYSFE